MTQHKTSSPGAGSRLERLRRALSEPQIPVLAAILLLGFWVRIAERNYFAGDPHYWSVTAFHLASARAISEGKPFFYIPEDRKTAHRFLFDQQGSFNLPLSDLDRQIDFARRSYESTAYEPYYADQSGWGFLIYLARKIPGVNTLAGVCTVQILIDVGALLLLFPIGVFITGRPWLALVPCALYAIYLPLAFASAEPFRDAWPGMAILYSMGILLPAWKRGPARLSLKSAAWMLGAGAAIGLATYVRSTVVTTPVTLFVITWILWKRFWPSVAAGATVLAGALVVLSPWMLMTYTQAHVVSPTSSGGGHTFLIGMGEEPDNPMGLRFDDTSALVYVRDVCGYDVKYLSFPYSAACLKEAKRFIADHRAWYAKIVARRVWTHYLHKQVVPRLKWGFGNRLSLAQRALIERWLPPLGMLGMILGMFVFPHAWIPLAWVLHFWLFIFPFHSHPRLLLGAEWALLTGLVMLVAGVGLLFRRTVLGAPGDVKTAKGAKKGADAEPAAGPGPEEAGATRGFRVLAAGALGFDLVLLLLMAVFRPVAPAEAFDWRAGLASPDPGTRVETLARAEKFGNDALPIWMAGIASKDPAVEARTVEAARSYQFPLGRFDFADGKNEITTTFPGVDLKPVPTPDAANGYALRATAPRGRQLLFLLAWPDTLKRGLYRITVTARGDGEIRIAFITGEGVPVKEESFDIRTGNRFQTWEIPYENHSHLDPIIAAFELTALGGGGPQMQAEFDSIEIWAEAGYQDYQPP